MDWTSDRSELPKPQTPESNGVWGNGQLHVIYYSPYDSLEFGVLIERKDGLKWEMPDTGEASLDEVSKWTKEPILK